MNDRCTAQSEARIAAPFAQKRCFVFARHAVRFWIGGLR
jgi:hypothetical protein